MTPVVHRVQLPILSWALCRAVNFVSRLIGTASHGSLRIRGQSVSIAFFTAILNDLRSAYLPRMPAVHSLPATPRDPRLISFYHHSDSSDKPCTVSLYNQKQLSRFMLPVGGAPGHQPLQKAMFRSCTVYLSLSTGSVEIPKSVNAKFIAV